MNKNTTKAAVWYLIQDYNTLIIRDFLLSRTLCTKCDQKVSGLIKIRSQGFMAEYWCKLASATVLNGWLRMFQYKSVLIVFTFWNEFKYTNIRRMRSIHLIVLLTWCAALGLRDCGLLRAKKTLSVSKSQLKIVLMIFIYCICIFFGWNRI